VTVAGLDGLLSPEGWPYASTPPVEPGDPGRFHALFGRDSLICSLQVLPARPDVARATLRALAALQGREEHPGRLEEPGKIGHEFRPRAPEAFVATGWPEEAELRYYGTADATSWFLIVLAAAAAAGPAAGPDGGEPGAATTAAAGPAAGPDGGEPGAATTAAAGPAAGPDGGEPGAATGGGLVAELEPAWRAAGGWLERALERGGGLVRHAPGTWGALTQQGWRDAIDPVSQEGQGSGILRPDGTQPPPPLADVDSQAAAHAALRALARLSGDDRWEALAAGLRARLAALGPEVMAVEADGRPVRGAGSQLGWLLWADALEGEACEAAAERLCAPDVLTGSGLRTLSSESPVFAPGHYHRGSVWPFDSWLGWGGLRAAGRVREAERVRTGVLAALDRLGRAPEFYAVGLGGEVEPIALSNRVQAWTVGARWALEHRWDGRG